MGTSAKVLAEALELPRDQRADLALQLLHSLDDEPPAGDATEISAAWAVEIERRIAAREAGEATARPLHEAIDDIRAKLAAGHKSNAR